MDGETIGRLTYLLLLLAAVAGWVFVEYRGRLGTALRAALAWGMIFLGVMAGYVLWQDISRDVIPRQAVLEGGEIVLPRAQDGHYYVTLTVAGEPVEFVVDTGATNVVLSGEDARRVGINPATLAFTGQAMTANGTVRTARVTLEDVALGGIRDGSLRAYVTDGEMDISLLGMDYLGRFRIAIENDEMVLRP
jgi:aspartyl protease family protein